jgi:response regulator NasT
VRVIIAEDEALIRMDLKEMLEEEGHEVVGEAADGEEAVALARKLEPDLVFMDVKMPRKDGIEAASEICAAKIAPVVMVTAFSQQAHVEEACSAGAMGYVVKPFGKQDVLPAMQVAQARFREACALEDEIDELGERLEARKLVERAKGLLMEQGATEADAFRRLQKLAMDKRLTLKDVAQAVILAAEAQADAGHAPRESAGTAGEEG